MDKKIEAKGCKVICPKQHNWLVAELGASNQEQVMPIT